MAAELNALFEEGITRCGELTERVDAAMDAVEDAVDRARDVAESVVKEGSAAAQRLRDIAGRVQEVLQAVEGSRREASASFTDAGRQAADLDSAVASLQDRVREATDHLSQQRSRVDEALDEHMATTQARFTNVANRTQELESDAGRNVEQADAAIAALRGAMETARAELVQKQGAWTAALETLAGLAEQRTSAWIAGLQASLQSQASAMVDAANAMIERHNDTMDAVKEGMVKRLPADLQASVAPLEAALRHLEHEAAEILERPVIARADELQAAVATHSTSLAGLRNALHGTRALV